MNLLQFSPAVLWSGLAAIAATLYLLQRLRVRFRQVDTVTTLFWRQAQQENRTRVLTHRFRHPWVYLFLLAIASLLWIAASGLRSDGEGDRDYLLVLDGSLAMTQADLWDQAVEELMADAAALPQAQREVWLAQEPALLLLQKGEHELLLQERLATCAAKQQPSNLQAILFRHAADPIRRDSTQARIYGVAQLSDEAAAALPADMELVYRSSLPNMSDNHGILAADWREAASGDWLRVDFAVTLLGDIGSIEPTLAGQPISQQGEVRNNEDGSTTILYADLAADGSELVIQIGATDGYAVDNHFRCTLPNRNAIPVHVAADVAEPIATLVDSDPGLSLSDATTAAVVIRSNASPTSSLPQLTFTTAASNHAFQVHSASHRSAEELLAEAVPALGVAQIDGLALAESLQQEVSIGASLEGGRQIQLWSVLLDPEHGFVRSQSFPQFLSRSLRWLAAQPMTESVSQPSALDPAVSWRFAQAQAAVDPADIDAEERSWPLWSILILLALALLLMEWAWFHQGRLP